MPTIYRGPNFTIYIYNNDHNPPHFHIRASGGEAIVIIDDLTVDQNSGVPRGALRDALDWAADNKLLLEQSWSTLNP